jgi:hypothetical protein
MASGMLLPFALLAAPLFSQTVRAPITGPTAELPPGVFAEADRILSLRFESEPLMFEELRTLEAIADANFNPEDTKAACRLILAGLSRFPGRWPESFKAGLPAPLGRALSEKAVRMRLASMRNPLLETKLKLIEEAAWTAPSKVEPAEAPYVTRQELRALAKPLPWETPVAVKEAPATFAVPDLDLPAPAAKEAPDSDELPGEISGHFDKLDELRAQMDASSLVMLYIEHGDRLETAMHDELDRLGPVLAMHMASRDGRPAWMARAETRLRWLRAQSGWSPTIRGRLEGLLAWIDEPAAAAVTQTPAAAAAGSPKRAGSKKEFSIALPAFVGIGGSVVVWGVVWNAWPLAAALAGLALYNVIGALAKRQFTFGRVFGSLFLASLAAFFGGAAAGSANWTLYGFVCAFSTFVGLVINFLIDSAESYSPEAAKAGAAKAAAAADPMDAEFEEAMKELDHELDLKARFRVLEEQETKARIADPSQEEAEADFGKLASDGDEVLKKRAVRD